MRMTTATAATRAEEVASSHSFAARAAVFAALGLALYAVAYVAAEQISGRHAGRNRFQAIASHPPMEFDHVILGASHAAVLDYRDLTSRLEAMTGARIINLSIIGGGIVPGRLLLDYVRTRHRARSIVYVVDSFVFYSAQWNEERLADTRLFRTAPFDPALAGLLLSRRATWLTAADYLTGFSKINNPDRFVDEVAAEEGSRFDRAYRPVPQLDRERLAYLYPHPVDPRVVDRYLEEFDALIASARHDGAAVLVVKPPLPTRVRTQLPDEPGFDRRLRPILERHGARFLDLSAAADDERHFADTDHLNHAGVLAFFEVLAPLLGPATAVSPSPGLLEERAASVPSTAPAAATVYSSRYWRGR